MEYSLGIDTSNYKTSLAIINEKKEIVFDKRIPLEVKLGERGLRQQEALFQHINNLPILAEEAFDRIENKDIRAISCSDKPRKIEGSYMPCFLAGVSVARVLASSLGLKPNFFSHQEGHIAAAKYGTSLSHSDDFVFFHFSGGTTEALRVKGDSIEIIGGTKDISFGQLIDRVGTRLGLEFPSGEWIDKYALECGEDAIKGIKNTLSDDLYINLSGLETQFLRLIDEKPDYYLGEEGRRHIAKTLMEEVSRLIENLVRNIIDRSEDKKVRFLFGGGVSSSEYLRNYMSAAFNDLSDNSSSGDGIVFSEKELSSDNAVGIALLGGI